MEIEDPKLHIIIHNDFLDYNGLEDVFSNCNALFWCLGISQSQVNKFEYEKITYDYTIKAAETVQKVNPTMVFVFLSGAGADNTEKSKAIFARIKGKTENKLKNLGLTNLYIVRPGGIKPIHKNPDAAFFNKLIIPIFPLIDTLLKFVNPLIVKFALIV